MARDEELYLCPRSLELEAGYSDAMEQEALAKRIFDSSTYHRAWSRCPEYARPHWYERAQLYIDTVLRVHDLDIIAEVVIIHRSAEWFRLTIPQQIAAIERMKLSHDAAGRSKQELAAAWLYDQDRKAAPMGELFWRECQDLPSETWQSYMKKVEGIEKILNGEVQQ